MELQKIAIGLFSVQFILQALSFELINGESSNLDDTENRRIPRLAPSPKPQQSSYVRGCYYTNWAQYRNGKGKYMPENYTPGLCTHIFYAFAVMNETFHIKPFEWNDQGTDYSKGLYQRVNDLKKLQPDLKTLISFGGWTFCEQNKRLIKSMASDYTNRHTFIKSALEYTQTHGFNGFDLDWEYPEWDDRQNYAMLIKEMSSVFWAHKLLLTAAVSAAVSKIEAGYDIPLVALHLDYVNVMTYDLHGSWEKFTGFNSPLYDRNWDQLSMNTAVEYWAANGVPRHKILVGFAAYGRSWTLTNANEFAVGSGGGLAKPGPFTQETGFLAYYEICEMLANGGKRFFCPDQKVPYMVYQDQWVGYDDIESYNIKLKWLKEKNFGGVFVWTLDLDDFGGTCSSNRDGNQRYPLVGTILKELSDSGSLTAQRYPPNQSEVATASVQVSVGSIPLSANQISPFTSSHSSSSANQISPFSTTIHHVTQSMIASAGTFPIIAPQTNNNNNNDKDGSSKKFACPSSGLFPDPNSCLHFYSCHVSVEAYHMSCSPGLNFNPRTKTCDWPNNAQCHLVNKNGEL